MPGMAAAATKSDALWVIRRLRSAGYRALLAGGCVRDMLLGRRPGDYDVATDAQPRDVRRLFRRVLLVGARFGVAIVLRRDRKIEVATFRSDLCYTDGRRPDGVRFATPEEDALRRDFTINGMFYDPAADEVIDHVGGRKDLRAGIIRTIGPPEDRFAEDYLRMVRAVRFAVRLGFRIDPATAAAVRKLAPKAASVSGERIFDELSKMLSLPSAAEALEQLHELRLGEVLLPELTEGGEAWPAAVRRVRAVAGDADVVLSLAALLGRVGSRAIGRIVRRWGAANDLRDGLVWLAGRMDGWRRADELSLAEVKRLLAHRECRRLRRLWGACERLATGGRVHTRRFARRVGAIAAAAVAPPPLVTGDDLLALGLAQGPAVGRILGELYEAQLNETLRTRREALAAARRRVEQGPQARGS